MRYYWCHTANFGDAINPIVAERIFHQSVTFASKYTTKCTGFGSILQRFQKKSGAILAPCLPTLHIWSSGFISADNRAWPLMRRIRVHALRGKLSLRYLERLQNTSVKPVLGDGGLLMNLLLDKRPQKKFSVGIVPHVADYDNPIFSALSEHFDRSTIINLAQNPLHVLDQIASCDYIISTSLHGLIAADSLGIPNQWVRVSDKVIGGNFKFHDYYSVFDINQPTPVQLSMDNIHTLSVNNIVDSYKITPGEVQKVQQNLLNSFPSL